MKAQLSIRNHDTGEKKTFACIVNNHLDLSSKEEVLQEFEREGGKLPVIKSSEEIEID